MPTDRLMNAVVKFETRDDVADILETYLKIHQNKNKIGMHWLYAAISRIAAGYSEEQTLEDFGYSRTKDENDFFNERMARAEEQLKAAQVVILEVRKRCAAAVAEWAPEIREALKAYDKTCK